MNQQLQSSINLLNQSSTNAVCVQYKDALGIYRMFSFPESGTNATKEILEKNYGSINGFFDYLFKNNLREIKVIDRKKSGNSFGKKGDWYEVTFTPSNETESIQPEIKSNPLPAVQPTQNIPAMQNNNQYAGMNGGLNGTDIHKIYNYDTLKENLAETKSEIKVLNSLVETLKADKVKLEQKIFESEVLGTKSVEKKNATNEMLAQFTPLVPILMERFAPVPMVATGLASASQEHTNLMTVINSQPTSFVDDLSIVTNLMLTNPDFDTKLNELINQFY